MTTVGTPYKFVIAEDRNGFVSIFLQSSNVPREIPEGLHRLGTIPLQRTLQAPGQPPRGTELLLDLFLIALSFPETYAQNKLIIEIFLTLTFRLWNSGKRFEEEASKRSLREIDSLASSFVNLTEENYRRVVYLFLKAMETAFKKTISYEALESVFIAVKRLLNERKAPRLI